MRVCVCVRARMIDWYKVPSLYYVRFQTNTLEKGMNSLVPPAMGQIVSMLFLYKDDFGIRLPTKF